jgi:hypothetical protein
MKIFMVITLLSSFSVFAQKGSKQDFIRCATKCGAAENFTKPVTEDTCERVRLSAGCYCGSLNQINDQVKLCK